ncbi:MAG: MoxR family ATPase [Clostridia bacterium]|nr:MoxR family ATPase [Clostridia bacterium]MBQ2348923.1 MoxR family ATPase [Clostridia bacterium]
MKQAAKIISEVKKVVVGKDEILIKVMEVILAGGNILIEDIPGVGKTTMALAFSKAMQLDCKRVQFTPDVMPSDITGYSVYNKHTGTTEYKEGAGLCNLLLADEINRTSSKTQSALLELMEEHAVTVDGITHKCPMPHMVIATQNHIGTAGVLPLPESQMDRFTVRLTMGYPSVESEVMILKERQTSNPLERVEPAATSDDIIEMRNSVEQVYRNDEIFDYIARLVKATRENDFIRVGVSPRGALAISNMAAACAYLHRRDYVVPEDVKSVFTDVCAHRIVLTPQARMSAIRSDDICKEIVKTVAAPTIRS